MPLLDNPKHEIFAQELAKGNTADEAYVLAGFHRNRGNATRLKANESIAGRVAELLAASSERTELTVENLLREAADLQRRAADANQFSAAIGALKMRAVLAGLWIKKSENTNNNRNVDPNRLSDEELVAIIEGNRRSVS